MKTFVNTRLTCCQRGRFNYIRIKDTAKVYAFERRFARNLSFEVKFAKRNASRQNSWVGECHHLSRNLLSDLPWFSLLRGRTPWLQNDAPGRRRRGTWTTAVIKGLVSHCLKFQYPVNRQSCRVLSSEPWRWVTEVRLCWLYLEDNFLFCYRSSLFFVCWVWHLPRPWLGLVARRVVNMENNPCLTDLPGKVRKKMRNFLQNDSEKPPRNRASDD